MTETTKVILDKYQVRKTKPQKKAFADYVEQVASDWGYSFKVEKGTFGANNLIVGDPSSAKVVYSAHYDTAPVLPFPNFITPKNIFYYILYNIAIIAGFLIAAFLIGFAAGTISSIFNLGKGFARICGYVVYLLLFLVFFAGPANKHTANDNTSGVTTLLDIMRDLPEDRRSEAAFIFFDYEEMGLLGSSAYARAHKNEMKDRLLINFDCVSDGNNMFFVLRKGAKVHRAAIEKAFAQKEGFNVIIAENNAFYPSDQAKFNCGVGVAALNSTKGGLLYMNRIHTSRDVIFREENIEFFKNGAIELLDLI